MDEHPTGPERITNSALVEFAALREEMINSMTWQHTLIGLNVTAIAAIAGVILANNADIHLLLVVPFFSSAIALVYIKHAVHIGEIGEYIRDELAPLVREQVDYRVFRWEQWHNDRAAQNKLRILRAAGPLIVLFIIAPVTALILVLPNLSVWSWTVWALGLVLLLAEVIAIAPHCLPYRTGHQSDADHRT
jgi:hypothetical protein